MPDVNICQPVPRISESEGGWRRRGGRYRRGGAKRRLEGQPGMRMIFVSAPSQEATLRHLAARSGIDWDRVTAFHMDEPLGLAPEAPQQSGTWLRAVLLDRV